MPDGKPANEFAFNAEPKNKEFAENIIAGNYQNITKLVKIRLGNMYRQKYRLQKFDKKIYDLDQ